MFHFSWKISVHEQAVTHVKFCAYSLWNKGMFESQYLLSSTADTV